MSCNFYIKSKNLSDSTNQQIYFIPTIRLDLFRPVVTKKRSYAIDILFLSWTLYFVYLRNKIK